jgi:hypothetical protein
MFDKILNYDLYTKIDILNTRFKNHPYIKIYKLYKIFYYKIGDYAITHLKISLKQNDSINSLYYESFINDLYKEWYSELNLKKIQKYKLKIIKLSLELNNLIKLFKENSKS